MIEDSGLREIDMGVCQDGWDDIPVRFPEFMEAFSRHESDVPYFMCIP